MHVTSGTCTRANSTNAVIVATTCSCVLHVRPLAVQLGIQGIVYALDIGHVMGRHGPLALQCAPPHAQVTNHVYLSALQTRAQASKALSMRWTLAKPWARRCCMQFNPFVCIHTLHRRCLFHNFIVCPSVHADTRSGIQGIVYALDIGQVMGDKMPLCKETDYEQWTVPADDHTPRCLLGELPG